jgi:hypothetical protein
LPTACLLIRDKPHYRHDAFLAGLRTAGWQVTQQPKPGPGNLLVIWNRYGVNDDLAAQYERAGGHVLVAENGYFAEHGKPPSAYAISRGQHHHGGVSQIRASNDAGKWDMKPWRTEGDHILVVGQRGIGSRLMASPPEWANGQIADRLGVQTRRPVRFRRHPGNDAPKVPLEHDLRGAHAVVIWSSCSGIAALLAGIPVFYAAPRWICEMAAIPLAGADLERPWLGDRVEALANAAANQWSVEEIARGLPFAALLPPAGQGQGA